MGNSHVVATGVVSNHFFGLVQNHIVDTSEEWNEGKHRDFISSNDIKMISAAQSLLNASVTSCVLQHN